MASWFYLVTACLLTLPELFSLASMTSQEPEPQIFCADLEASPNMIIERSRDDNHFIPGDEVLISCLPGYVIRDGSDQLYCEDDGSWDAEMGRCEAANCDLPQIPKNGSIRELQDIARNTIPNDFEINYACDSGFRLIGTNWNKCQGARWAFEVPLCQDIKCYDPGTPDNGVRHGNSFSIGSKVSFACFSGYNLIGSYERYCLPNGQWSGELTRCNSKNNYCPDPGVPINGMKTGSSYDEGSSVKYRCHREFILVGSETRECQRDRSWTGTEPICRGFYDFDSSAELVKKIRAAVEMTKEFEGRMPPKDPTPDGRRIQVCPKGSSYCSLPGVPSFSKGDIGQPENVGHPVLPGLPEPPDFPGPRGFPGLPGLPELPDFPGSPGQKGMPGIPSWPEPTYPPGTHQFPGRKGDVIGEKGAADEKPLFGLKGEKEEEQVFMLEFPTYPRGLPGLPGLPQPPDFPGSPGQKGLPGIPSWAEPTNRPGTHQFPGPKGGVIGEKGAADEKTLFGLKGEKQEEQVFMLEIPTYPGGNLDISLSEIHPPTIKPQVVDEPVTPEKHPSRVIMYFVFDSSGSVNSQYFQMCIAFAKFFVRKVNISTDGNRVGAISFNSRATVHFTPVQFESTEHVQEALDEIQHSTGGGTSVNDALEVLATMMPLSETVLGMNTKSVVYLFTDGKANMRGDPRYMADKLKEKGVEIYCIGIPETLKPNLYKMASEPVKEHVFILSAYNQMDEIIQMISNDKVDYFQCGRGLEGVAIKQGQTGESDFVKKASQPWPWMAALYFSDRIYDVPNRVRCGGSIIGQQWILTAAHCLINRRNGRNIRDLRTVIIKLGITNLKNESTVLEFSPEAFFLHPKFDLASLDYDVALVKLERLIDYSAYARPICLPPRNSPKNKKLYQYSDYAFVTGWGDNRRRTGMENARSLIRNVDHLKEIALTVHPRNRCLQSLRNTSYIFTKRMFCAGSESSDSCGGDSGGPMMQSQSDEEGNIYWVQVGIVSWGIGCQQSNGFYTHVHNLRKWIKRTMNSN